MSTWPLLVANGPYMAHCSFQLAICSFQMPILSFHIANFSFHIAISSPKRLPVLQIVASWGGLVGPPLGLATFLEKRY